MMNKIKAILSSEKMMGVINTLFLLSLMIRNSGIIFIAYIVWIMYLTYVIRKSTSKSETIINGVFLVFAVIMIMANLYFMVKSRN